MQQSTQCKTYLRHIERNLDVTHRSQVVNLIGFDIGDNCDEVCSVTKISIVEEELNSSFVTVTVDVINSPSVKRRRSTDDTMNLTRRT